MNTKSWGVLALFFLFLFQTTDNQAQNIEKSYTIQWESNLLYVPDEDHSIELLYFKNAINNNNEFPTLPVFFDRIAVDAPADSYDITIQNLTFVPLESKDIHLIPANFDQTSIVAKAIPGIERKKNYATFSFIPIIKRGTNQFEKLVSFDVKITGTRLKSTKSKSYAAHSVLQSGNWYRIAVNRTGMHKVTYQDLATLGIPMSNLRSENISLFGNGGGMLPEANSQARLDDLQENPIEMFDGGDGIFNEGDYFIFYSQGPHKWEMNAQKRFVHRYNIYSDYAYYFINVDYGVGEKKRISQVDDYLSLTPTMTVSTYNHYDFYERDSVNFEESGQLWFGDAFSETVTRRYSFSVPTLVTPSSVRLSISGAAAAPQGSSFSVSVNSQYIGSMSMPALTNYVANPGSNVLSFTANSPSLEVLLTYSKPTVRSVGYLDWIRIEALCNLQMHNSQFPFCNVETIGSGNITEFVVSNANSSVKVWDVTEAAAPFRLGGTLTGNVLRIKTPTDTLRKFVAFDGSSFFTVTPIGRITNQNLHGTSNVDMVIVTHPDFSSQAERLAQFRRDNDGLTVKIVTPQQIYNEFSSGAQDVTAIRDYMRMIYDKSNHENPKYLLLFGRPSADYRGRKGTVRAFVPNYQVNTGLHNNDFRSNDDYFGLLDENEGSNCVGYVDVAIGRFPANTATQAKIAVDKTIAYSSKNNLVTNVNSAQISNFADWRNMLAFVADDEDSNDHLRAADDAATMAETKNPNINLDKIYLDAFQQVSHAGGQRYPEVNTAINHRMDRGALVVSYFGHGGPSGWATERVLEISDISRWKNKYNQPLMLTLTCDFGAYDKTATSPGELCFFNDKGGASSLITTSRVAFTGANHTYGVKLYENIFTKENNRPKTIGEINMTAKNAAGGAYNALNMIYTLGDPSMKLAIPTYLVVTDSINGAPVSGNIDTLKALTRVTIKGKITDDGGNTLTNFNGNIYPSVYDKKVKTGTLQNDPGSPYFEFDLQKNILFKGNASVTNGYFEFTFIVPRDINFEFGKGKISYYARSNNADAAGYFNDAIIGGVSGNAIADTKGPTMELFMNDEKFVNGGVTDPNPTLIVKLSDEFGINTTGNGIGHDLVAILDDASDKQIVLNDYYEAKQDSFNCGTVRYKFENLTIGKHRLKVRAWDIFNNPSEDFLDFEVLSDAKLALDHVLNYPNPFTTRTSFYFEHNQPGAVLDVKVQIFTISGKLIKTIDATQYSEGYRSEPMEWDGRDDFGDRIGKGVYIYRLKVKNQEGEVSEKIEKVVIL